MRTGIRALYTAERNAKVKRTEFTKDFRNSTNVAPRAFNDRRTLNREEDRRTPADCKVSDIALVIAFILAFKPYLVQLNYGVDTLWDYATAIVSCCFFIAVIAGNKLKGSHICLGLFCIIYCISTYLCTPSNVFGAVSESLRICLAFYCITYCLSSVRMSPIKIVRRISIIFLLLDLIVGILNYAHPFLTAANYSLFGLDNYAIFYVLPLLSIVAVADLIVCRKVSFFTVVLFLMTLGLKIATGALAAIIALLVFGCALYFTQRKVSSASLLLNSRFWFICIFVMTIAVVAFQIQDYFTEILNMLGRDATLSFRTTVWSKTIDAIIANPIIGYGKTGSGIFQTLVGLSPIYDTQASHAHNYILELLFDSGLCGTALFGAFLYFTLKKSNKKKRTDNVLMAGYAGLLGFAFLMFADSYIFTPGLYCLLAILEGYMRSPVNPNEDQQSCFKPSDTEPPNQVACDSTSS